MGRWLKMLLVSGSQLSQNKNKKSSVSANPIAFILESASIEVPVYAGVLPIRLLPEFLLVYN
jgi:hypothetical protein